MNTRDETIHRLSILLNTDSIFDSLLPFSVWYIFLKLVWFITSGSAYFIRFTAKGKTLQQFEWIQTKGAIAMYVLWQIQTITTCKNLQNWRIYLPSIVLRKMGDMLTFFLIKWFVFKICKWTSNKSRFAAIHLSINLVNITPRKH